MSKKPIIRPVRESDRADWQRLWTDYLSFYETCVSAEVYRVSFSRLLSGVEREFHGLIAECDGKPCGLVHYLFHRHMWRVEQTCYLQDLFAEHAMRGKGVG
ncbi:MAG: GNAT family N-acetyltransferase, partial [Paracoccaceae bacterium]